MKQFVDMMDNLPLVIKLILCIPAIAVIWWVYRIVKSLSKENTFGVIIGIVLLIVGIPFMWLVDLICILLKGNVVWVD